MYYILFCDNCKEYFVSERNKRKYCYECVPFNAKHGTPKASRIPHKCKICGKIYRGRNRQFCYECKPEGLPSTYVIRKHIKPLFGNKCAICGYDRCIEALDFHHLNPEDKDFELSNISVWDKAIEEAKKCILVCSNCHREIHHGFITLDKDGNII